MLLALTQELGGLKALGFSRWEAVCILTILCIGGYLRGMILRDRRERERLLLARDQDRTKIEDRLTASEAKHDECDKDRRELRDGQHRLELEVTRLKACPKGDKCPMRLPP